MNRRVRSMMRKPKYRWGGLKVSYFLFNEFMMIGQSNMSGRVFRRQLLHKGKKP